MDDEILKYLYDIKDAASAFSAPHRTSSPGFARRTNSFRSLLNR